MSTQRKGPERCSASEPVSLKPLEGKKMDIQIGITNKARKQSEMNALHDLEMPIVNLHLMAQLMADLFDRDLIDFRTIDGKSRPDGSWHIMLTDSQMQVLTFVYGDLLERATNLRAAFYASLEAEGKAA